jgi:hypothetical protein
MGSDHCLTLEWAIIECATTNIKFKGENYVTFCIYAVYIQNKQIKIGCILPSTFVEYSPE